MLKVAEPLEDDFAVKLAEFDRVGFGLTMRKIEVLLLRDNPDQAIAALQHFIAHKRLKKASLASHPAEVLPLKIANRLDEAGLLTMYAVAGSTDEEILAIPECSVGVLKTIRSVQDRVSRGVFNITPHAPELEPEWELDFSFEIDKEPRVSKPSIKDALSVLLADRESGIAELDAEIADMESELAKLREMRSLLAGEIPRRTGVPKPSKQTLETEQEVWECLKKHAKPMTAQQIGSHLRLHYVSVGNAVKFSNRIRRRGKYLELA